MYEHSFILMVKRVARIGVAIICAPVLLVFIVFIFTFVGRSLHGPLGINLLVRLSFSITVVTIIYNN